MPYAYQNNDGSFDLDSLAESEDVCKHKAIAGCLGWRYSFSEDRQHTWERLLKHGKIVEVEIVIKGAR